MIRHSSFSAQPSVLGIFLFWLMVILLATALSLTYSASFADAYTKTDKRYFQKSIVDYRHNLNHKFKKIRRKKTKYIIVHTAEGGLKSTLKVVSKGKSFRGRKRTYGGHTHYVIARNGRTYRILNKKYRADHAGLSMWNRETNISNVSVGIELVGYHYTNITDKQNRSLAILIDILQDVYKVNDRAILTHSQVAYGRPNRWIKKDHRGRKRCADNFDRLKAGVGPTWSYDPDVRSGRLAPDPKLASIFYGPRVEIVRRTESNIIAPNNTAWNIAGEDYNSSFTLYRLPDGRLLSGNHVASKIGWGRIPKGTVVMLNQERKLSVKSSEGPVKTIANGLTAWTFAGADYKKKTTFYFFPNGHIKSGRRISDWDELPMHTRILVGYRGPYKITKTKTPGKIAGTRYNHQNTVYLFPNQTLKTGDKIKDFKKLPRGVRIFLPVKSS